MGISIDIEKPKFNLLKKKKTVIHGYFNLILRIIY